MNTYDKTVKNHTDFLHRTYNKVDTALLELYGGYVQHRKNECHICGEKGGNIYDEDGYLLRKQHKANNLTVHHLDENNENNDPNNLQTLCRDCHDLIHGTKRPKVWKRVIDKNKVSFRSINCGKHI